MFKLCLKEYYNGRPCHDPGGYSPPSYVGDLGSVPGPSVWDKVAMRQVFFFFEHFGFLLSLSFHQCSVLIFTLLLLE